MSLITDPDFLSQGNLTPVGTLTDLVVTNPGSGADVTLSSVGTNIPALAANDFIEIRDHSDADANGLYRVVTVTTPNTTIQCDKVTGNVPATAGAEAAEWYGDTTIKKSVFFDAPARLCYLIEVGTGDTSPVTLTEDGTTMQAVYSFTKQEWKNDNYLKKFPFPFVSVTPEQFEIGNDGTNANGWNWGEVTEALSPAVDRIRTRKLLRTCGWSEIDATGNTIAQYFCPITLGSFEDNLNDVAYYQLGTDTEVDDSVDFDFAGPVNEAIKTFEEFAITSPQWTFATTSTITRADGGSFVTDGFKVGGQVTVRAGTVLSPSNNGTYVLTAVTATTLTVTGTPFTTGTDPGSVFAADNRNSVALRLRIRDADTNGKTFGSSDLAAIGLTAVTNKAERFPLSNATDLKITATDADIDGSPNDPYELMTITYHPSGQTRTGFVAASPTGTADETEGLFGIIIEGNFGSAEQVYEFVQRQLRKTTDIDNDASTAIGRTMDELMRFVGDSLEVGSKDGGISFPRNPSGGGTGVFYDNRDSNDTNRLSFVDNFGNVRTFPFVAAGTITFNANLVNDGNAVFTMFFQYTTRTNLTDGAIVTPTGNTGDLESPGGNLPTMSVNDYIAVSGFVNTENNGIYQVDAINVANQDYTVTKVDNQTLVAESGVTIDVDENPIDSPDAIIVNSATTFSPIPITGTIVSSSVNFDFDYDNNVQGGRASGNPAAIVIRAIGLDTAQYAEVTGTITRATGLSFSLVSALERNYANP
jgi:hypothetical protein